MAARVFSLIVLGFFFGWTPGIKAAENPVKELKVIFPVTCVSPGLANGLAKLFEAQYKIPVKVLSLCTGDAIKFVKEHEADLDVDVMMGHDQEAEEQFIKDGFAVNFRQVCYSDFVLVGPKEDPAKVKGVKDALEALKIIAKAKANFCSRDDSSGTHSLEMRLWKMVKIKPAGDWYIKTRVGTSETLVIAAKKRAYFISQWASFKQMEETVDLVPLVEDTTKLFTNYDIMAINPERFPKANYVSAMLFIGFITSPEVQKYIADFGIEKFHRQSFIPLAVKISKQQKDKK
ncbi:MAG TPA: substrate-binding domain-containing protein [Chitinivibrionales bacterium]|nr:substrate-binding domain-containing protein [Chitinivibrionales bacterium]